MRMTDDIVHSFIGELIKKISPQSLIRKNLGIENGWIDARDERSGISLSVPLPRKGRIFIFAIGKAAPEMMSSFRGLGGIPERCDMRYAVLSNLIPADLRMEDTLSLTGNHPYPDADDIENVRSVKGLLSDVGDGDLVVVLLSGGASSLLFSPREGVKPEFKIALVRQLMLSGADIISINTVRTYLSDSKGGGFLRWTGNAEVLSLVFSDVMGDDLRYVGSGPTFPNDPSQGDVIAILERYRMDPSMISEIGRIGPRAPVRPDKPFQNVIIGNNESVLRSSERILKAMGRSAYVERMKFTGEARTSAPSILEGARRVLDSGYDAYLRGGEATVTVRGSGRGGRTLEMALSMVPMLRKDELAICFATDGSDGNSGYAGAWVSSGSGIGNGIEAALSNNDTAGFFDSHPGGIRTGPTGQNLGDLFVLLRDPRRPSRGPPRPGTRT
jgi:glycerate 2-kinase